jgi:MFS family permease
MTTTTAATAPAFTAGGRHVMGAGAALTVGVLVSALAELIHPHHESANNHHRVFAEYAASTAWTWVHYLQFGAALTVIVGFLLLRAAISAYGHDSILARIGSATGVATLAVFAVNMAVDGIALKQSVDAWAAAPPGERAARYASAETVRWLEWGANAFFQILLGITVILFGLAMVRTGAMVTGLGWTATVAGIGLVANGILTGFDGFAATPLAPVSMLLFLLASTGIAVDAHRRRPDRRPKFASTRD